MRRVHNRPQEASAPVRMAGEPLGLGQCQPQADLSLLLPRKPLTGRFLLLCLNPLTMLPFPVLELRHLEDRCNQPQTELQTRAASFLSDPMVNGVKAALMRQIQVTLNLQELLPDKIRLPGMAPLDR